MTQEDQQKSALDSYRLELKVISSEEMTGPSADNFVLYLHSEVLDGRYYSEPHILSIEYDEGYRAEGTIGRKILPRRLRFLVESFLENHAEIIKEIGKHLTEEFCSEGFEAASEGDPWEFAKIETLSLSVDPDDGSYPVELGDFSLILRPDASIDPEHLRLAHVKDGAVASFEIY